MLWSTSLSSVVAPLLQTRQPSTYLELYMKLDFQECIGIQRLAQVPQLIYFQNLLTYFFTDTDVTSLAS
jgi:hypothetical protein